MQNHLSHRTKSIITAIFWLVILAIPLVGLGEVTLPNWAQGNLDSDLQSTGQTVANTIGLVVGILATLGLLASGAMFAVGNSEAGKRFLSGAIIGMVLAASAYGIAQLLVN